MGCPPSSSDPSESWQLLSNSNATCRCPPATCFCMIGTYRNKYAMLSNANQDNKHNKAGNAPWRRMSREKCSPDPASTWFICVAVSISSPASLHSNSEARIKMKRSNQTKRAMKWQKGKCWVIYQSKMVKTCGNRVLSLLLWEKTRRLQRCPGAKLHQSDASRWFSVAACLFSANS